MRLSPSTLLLPALGIVTAQDWNPSDACPLLGPALYKNFNLSNTTAFLNATTSFPSIIASLFNSSAISPSTSSFIVDIYSTHTNTSLYTYTHRASSPALQESFHPEINDETIFRVGSVSKLYTVYAILAHAKTLDIFDVPVTDYLPELAGNDGIENATHPSIIWEKVTIGALASQQAGVGGFPLVSVACDPSPSANDTSACSIPLFLAQMREGKRPVQPVFASAQYSDGGFGVLGRVLERMTNMSYHDAVQELLGGPLGLKGTGTHVPTGEGVNAIAMGIGMPNSSWGWDNQVIAPSGGVYSNAADFRTTGLSILHSSLLSPETTRAWMKPRAHTSSLLWSVGAPWEINRLTLSSTPNSHHTRVSDLYTKAGGQPGYTALLMLSPDHGLGISVLVAGASALADRWPLRAAAAEVFVSAAEHGGKEYAEENFTGLFIDPTDDSSNMTLVSGAERPGLTIDTLFAAGVNVKPLPLGLAPENDVLFQIYPTGIEFPSQGEGELLQYRGVVWPLPVEGRTGLFDDQCISWLSVAGVEDAQRQYNDEFVLEVKEGRLESVYVPILGKSFVRA